MTTTSNRDGHFFAAGFNCHLHRKDPNAVWKDAVARVPAAPQQGFIPGKPNEDVEVAWLLVHSLAGDGEGGSEETATAVLALRGDDADWLVAGDWRANSTLDSVFEDGGRIIGWMPYEMPAARLAAAPQAPALEAPAAPPAPAQAQALHRARRALYAIGKTYDDSELRVRALEADEEIARMLSAAPQASAAPAEPHSLVKVCEAVIAEWSRQKGLFPVLSRDGWMDDRIAELRLAVQAVPAAPILCDAERRAAARQDKSLADYWRNRVAGLAEEFTRAAEASYLADRIVSELYDLPTSGVERPAAPAAPSGDERTAYVAFLTGTFPSAYSKKYAENWWDNSHVSALTWQAARTVAAAPSHREDGTRTLYIEPCPAEKKGGEHA